jgi:putative spermidine/putrescine transport system substrate-binding protein
MVDAKAVTWDVVQGGISQGVTSNPQLENLDCTVIDCKAFDGAPFPAYKQAVPLFTFSNVIAYNTDAFKGKTVPTGYQDFFNPAIKGQRDISATDNGWEGYLEAALLYDGVPRDKLYPLDVDRALKVFDGIKNELVVMTSDDQCMTDVASGEAIMGTCYNGRAAIGIQANQPVAIAWGQQVEATDYIMIPKGAPNVANAQKLIGYIVDNESAIGNYIGYSGANPTGKGLDPSSQWAKYLPSANVGTGANAPIVPDPSYWTTANLNANVEKISAWLSS